MKKITRSRPRSLQQWGQTMALVVFAMPALVVVAALATDIGNLYFNYYKLQTADDASVLAGAVCLPSGNNCNGTCGSTICTPTQTANYYATNHNGINAGEITGTTIGGSGTTITMGITRNVPYYFARLAGTNSGTVNVSAEAKGGPAGTVNVNDLLPIGLQVCGDPAHAVASCSSAYSVGQTLTFNEKGTAPGNWDPLSFSGSTVSVCTTGTGCIDSSTGCSSAKSAANLAQSLIAAGLSSDPSGTATSHTPNDPRAVAVPLVDWTGITGTKPMNVYGFAEIWLNSTTIGAGCSTNPAINATFIAQTINGQIDTTGTAFDVGPDAIKLIN